VAGWLANSLALMGDAGHMITDSFALGIAAVAAWLANRGATRTHSFGLGRVEFLAALLNSVIMLVLVAYIVVESVIRLLSDTQPWRKERQHARGHVACHGRPAWLGGRGYLRPCDIANWLDEN